MHKRASHFSPTAQRAAKVPKMETPGDHADNPIDLDREPTVQDMVGHLAKEFPREFEDKLLTLLTKNGIIRDYLESADIMKLDLALYRILAGVSRSFYFWFNGTTRVSKKFYRMNAHGQYQYWPPAQYPNFRIQFFNDQVLCNMGSIHGDIVDQVTGASWFTIHTVTTNYRDKGSVYFSSRNLYDFLFDERFKALNEERASDAMTFVSRYP